MVQGQGTGRIGGKCRGKKGNRLRHEKSPYLLQHAHNPWTGTRGGEAFQRAAAEQKLIFPFQRLFHLPLVSCYGQGNPLPTPKCAAFQ